MLWEPPLKTLEDVACSVAQSYICALDKGTAVPTTSDAGWYTFRQWLEYFGHKYGKITVAVPPHNTSQNCSNCGQKVKKSLSTRTHVCPHCGFSEDRDINAAINILRLGLSTAGHAGTYATGDLPSWAVGASLSPNGESVNVESPPYKGGECQL